MQALLMPPLPLESIVAAIAAFVSVALLTGLVMSRVLAGPTPEQERLKKLVQAAPRRALSPVAAPAMLPTQIDLPPTGVSTWLPKSTKDMSQGERLLAQAGYRTTTAITVFHVTQWALPIVLAGAALLWLGVSSTTSLFFSAVLGVLGYLAPGLYLDRAIAQRRKQIKNGLPDVLDLIIICLEAGNSLDQAVVKASEELGLAYPVLAEELRVLSTETRAGKPRMEAFRNLAQRTRVDDVRAMVAMLVQTDRFGTSVAQALRTLAESMRTARRQAAEERANKVGVKLVFPLVLFIFPAFFVVVLGPAMLRLFDAFEKMGH